MRRRHLFNAERGRTLCGHEMTHQEARTARHNTILQVNCKNCVKKYKQGLYEETSNQNTI